MLKTVQKYWNILNRSIYTGELLERNLRHNAGMGICMMLFGLLMTTLNIVQHKGLVTYSTAAVFFCGLITTVSTGVFHKRKPAVIATLVVFAFIFTIYAVCGTNEGFAILWSLVIPPAFCYFASVKYGLLLSLYYEALLAVLFYTPLRAHMVNYTEIFMTRFPILYLCALISNAVAMIQYHSGTLVAQDYEERLRVEVERQTRVAGERLDKLQRLSMEMVETLVGAIDAKDRYTNGHSLRVSQYSALIAEKAGIRGEELEDIRIEGLLHDIGKIGIPDSLLNKAGRLTERERMVVESHTLIGGSILDETESYPGARNVARYHHERYDGKGYPAGLKGTGIPLHARIAAIADSYDAMRSDRIYRKGLSQAYIREELLRGRGSQFDPELLDIFLQLLDEGVPERMYQEFTTRQGSGDEALRAYLAEKLAAAHSLLPEVPELSPHGVSTQPLYALADELEQAYPGRFVLSVVGLRPVAQADEGETELVMSALLFAADNALERSGVCLRCGKRQLLLLHSADKSEWIQRRLHLDFIRLADSTHFRMEVFAVRPGSDTANHTASAG